ncbi:MAG: CPBP family glutamic-type intramembrane protease [Acutalibacteraceae bacterium]|nr:CPBP family intramembrane metalloprotease [Clostridia bacterium]MEE3451022.1 CPBP family glutamic-type intramembrane protease [Acutalibacteraceae bacterium]
MNDNIENTITGSSPDGQGFQTLEKPEIPQATAEKQYTMRVPQMPAETPQQDYAPAYSVPAHTADYTRTGQTQPMQYAGYPAANQYANAYQPPYKSPMQISSPYNRYPQPAYAGAQVPAQYPYSYMYNYEQSPQELEKLKIKKDFSFAGKTTLILLGCLYLAVIIIEVFAVVCGVSKQIPDMKTDPYAGFTPMGFYLYEGLSSLIGIFIPSLILLKSTKIPMNELLPFKRVDTKFCTALIFGGMTVCMISQIAASIVITNFKLFGIDIDSALSSVTATSPFDILMNSVCTALIPALVEEFAYRGLVLGVLKKHDEAFAIFASAFLFGLLHGNFVQIPFAFLVGLVLAFVRVKSGSMLPGIIIHFGNNFFAVLATTASEAMSESNANIVEAVMMLLFIITGFISISYLVKNHKEIFEPKKSESSFKFGELTRMFLSTGTIIASMIILIILSLVLVAAL